MLYIIEIKELPNIQMEGRKDAEKMDMAGAAGGFAAYKLCKPF
jgi:hypothetical protein